MNFYGTGPFDNDEAKELLSDIRSGLFNPALMLPDKQHGYLDEEHGALLIALINLAMVDESKLPEGVQAEALADLRTPEARARLREAQDAVLADATVSGLYAHWEKEGLVHEWKAKSFVNIG